ncbi:MAG: hypothetical protein ACJ8DJ_03925 [Gemmatimonadales bacterium]
MTVRPIVVLTVGALLSGTGGRALAQQPGAAPQDTSAQGYAPNAGAAAPAAPAPAPAAPAPGASAAPAPAQPSTAAAATALASHEEQLKAMGFMDLVPPRSTERIQREMDEAKLDQRDAETDLAARQQQEAEVKAMVDVKKQEVSTLDARRKLAEKSKQEAEKTSLEAEKKDAERFKEFLDKRVALHRAEKDAAKAEIARAEATQRALELELELARRRGERPGVTDPAAALRSDNVVHELERKLLEARRTAADKGKDAADKQVDITKRRLELYQAQAAAGGNR